MNLQKLIQKLDAIESSVSGGQISPDEAGSILAMLRHCQDNARAIEKLIKRADLPFPHFEKGPGKELLGSMKRLYPEWEKADY